MYLCALESKYLILILYQQYHIGFSGTRYDIDLITTTDIGPIFLIWPIFSVLTVDVDDIDTKNH